MGVTGILLSGGIGSGKSTAAGMFAARGAVIISADAAGHRVLEPDGAAFAAVAARWPSVVRDGSIDRAVLAAVVFDDPRALAELEAITHPAIGRLVAEQVAEAEGSLTVVEVPLIRNGVPVLRDVVGPDWPLVVVDAPANTRRCRLAARGMDPEDIERRMAVQPSRSEWLAAADHVLDNGGDIDALARECDRLWELLGPG